ncbi:hypothetical protein ACFL6G_07800 [candidate division KSB1 bacterium]
MRRIRTGILGISTETAQHLASLLESHSFINVTDIADTAEYEGKRLKDLDIWKISDRIPPYIRSIPLAGTSPNLQCDLVFSCIGNSRNEAENRFADHNYPVITYSNNSSLDKYLPLIIPEVNENHVKLIKIQKKEKFRKRGFIASITNSLVFNIAIAAKPFIDRYSLKKICIGFEESSNKKEASETGLSGLSDTLRQVFGEFKISEIVPSDIDIELGNIPEHINDPVRLILDMELNRPVEELDSKKLFNLFRSISLKSNKYSVPENIINYPENGIKEYLTRDNYFTLRDFRQADDYNFQLRLEYSNSLSKIAGRMIILAEFLKNEGSL